MASDLVRHRSLVLALLVRQLQARYRGSILGFVWTFLNPLLLMAVYALVFRFFMRLAVPNYALFLLAGLLPWTWFASSLAEGTNSIVGGSSLVPESLQTLFLVNPMALFAESYQAVFVASTWPSPESLAMLTLYALVSIFVGARIFDGYRDTFPELV